MVGDEQVRAQIMRPRPPVGLIAAECWQLLASVPVGRVVFTMDALPAIRLVNHVTDGEKIIIRSHLGAAITGRAIGGAIVCYEADEVDLSRHTGWSVSVTGSARLITDPAEAVRYLHLLQPWAAGDKDQFVAIEPQLVTGVRLPGWCC